jgi:hypothetical protein
MENKNDEELNLFAWYVIDQNMVIKQFDCFSQIKKVMSFNYKIVFYCT